MRQLPALTAALFFCMTGLPAGAEPEVDLIRNAVTAEIKAGIEKHIEEEAARGGGYFQFSSGGKNYRFKLVRVHTEYLSRLGPERHFACVDLVDEAGDVYDTDFFYPVNSTRWSLLKIPSTSSTVFLITLGSRLRKANGNEFL